MRTKLDIHIYKKNVNRLTRRKVNSIYIYTMSVCNEKLASYMLNNLEILKKSIKPYIPFKNNPIR